MPVKEISGQHWYWIVSRRPSVTYYPCFAGIRTQHAWWEQATQPKMLPLPSLSVSTKKETLLRGETPLELIADTRKLYAVKGSKSPTWKKLRHRLRHKLRQSPVLQFAISCSQWGIQNLSPATGGIWTQLPFSFKNWQAGAVIALLLLQSSSFQWSSTQLTSEHF